MMSARAARSEPKDERLFALRHMSGKLSRRCVTRGKTALTMRAQAVPLTNAGNLVSGEGVIAPVADAGSIEALGDDSIVTKFKQLIDLCDQFGRRLLPSCYARACYLQTTARAATQADMRGELAMVLNNGNVLDQQRKDLLALAVNHGGILPEAR